MTLNNRLTDRDCIVKLVLAFMPPIDFNADPTVIAADFDATNILIARALQFFDETGNYPVCSDLETMLRKMETEAFERRR